MKKVKKIMIVLFAVCLLGGSFSSAQALSLSERLSGLILLQVEENGEAWYVYPVNQKRYYLGRPADAFQIMRELGLGISETDYFKFRKNVPTGLKGRILLRVQANGEAYYVDMDGIMHYLGRPADAFRVMRELGLGISNQDLARIMSDTKPPSVVQEDPKVITPPLAVLDSYDSLSSVKQRLDSLIIGDGKERPIISGRKALEVLLNDLNYDPQASLAEKKEVIRQFEQQVPELTDVLDEAFLFSVANSLFTEGRGLVPWSLKDYSQKEIDLLFLDHQYRQQWFWDNLPITGAGLGHEGYLYNKLLPAAHYQQYNLAFSLSQDKLSSEEAIKEVLVWLEKNFFHAYDDTLSGGGSYGWERYLDGQEPLPSGGPVAYPVNLERVYDERIIGCHIPMVMLEGLLHSLNIPAIRITSFSHGAIYLPTIDRYIHGDHVAMGTIYSGEALLMTEEDFMPFITDSNYGSDFALLLSPVVNSATWDIGAGLKREEENLFVRSRSNYTDFITKNCKNMSVTNWSTLQQALSEYVLS